MVETGCWSQAWIWLGLFCHRLKKRLILWLIWRSGLLCRISRTQPWPQQHKHTSLLEVILDLWLLRSSELDERHKQRIAIVAVMFLKLSNAELSYPALAAKRTTVDTSLHSNCSGTWT